MDFDLLVGQTPPFLGFGEVIQGSEKLEKELHTAADQVRRQIRDTFGAKVDNPPSEKDSRRVGFHDVDFTAADMRGTIYGAAEFSRCKFNHAKLNKVDFQSSTFTDCSFEGELREVMFYRRRFRGDRFPPNEMKRVDFRKTKLRWSEFRELDLDEVFFPADEDHIVVENYPETLDRLLAYFRERSDLGSRRLATCFEHDRKWLGPHQRVGVLNKQDLIESGGEDGLEAVMRIIGSAQCRPEPQVGFSALRRYRFT